MIDGTIWAEAGKMLIDAAISTGVILCFFGILLILAGLLQIITLSLRRKWYEILGEKSWIMLSLPGTVIHETGHALFCLLFRHRIVEMKLFAPAPDGTMGKVIHTWDPKNIYQRAGNFFIGTGPIILGTFIIILGTAMLLPEVWEEVESPGVYTLSDLGAGLASVTCRLIRKLFSPELWYQWQSWVWLGLMVLVGSHITLSREDLKNAASGFFLIPVLVFIINLAVIRFANPGEMLLKQGSSHLICILSVLLLILFVLGSFDLFLHLPVFQSAPPPQKKRR